ncbi:MAG TPA: kelch repeat-containing protein [Nakamurella sp.]|nr:kelch repeat-containing protein [Nakamurella sp.]
MLNHAVTVGSDGTIYAIGGYTPALAPSATVYTLAQGASSWETGPSLPAARFSLAAATGSDGTIYAIGGNNGGPKADVYTLAPGASEWIAGPSLPQGRQVLAAAVGSDGTIYAIGGLNTSFQPSAVVYKLTPGAGSWATAPSLPAARSGLTATAGADGTIYAIGGQSGDVYTLTPGASSWTTGVALPDIRSGAGSATTSDGTIYVIGGSNSATVSILAPGDTSWTAGPDLPAARNQAAAAISAGVLFEVGGDSGGLTGQAAVYTLAVDVDTTPPGPVSDLSSPGGIALAWANPTDTDFAGVMIRRMEGADAPANATDGDLVSSVGAAVTSYTDTGVTSGQQYTYALFAYDGHSNYADPVVITATASGAPLAKTTGQIWPRGKR